jgi:threonine dehydratase
MTKNKIRPDLEQITAAAGVIAGFTKPSPVEREAEFCRQLDADVHVKYEFFNPVKSFKIRGALNIAHALQKRNDIKRVVTCSTGNHGSAMAFACKQFGLPITVGVPVDCDRSKVELIRQFDAELEFIGRDLDETKEVMQETHQGEGEVFVVDGSSPEVVAGTATIGSELLEQLPATEVFIVPVGNGALIGGVGAAIKGKRPDISVIGVQAETAPCMALSFQAGKPVDTEHCDTFASGIAVRIAIPVAVDLVNDVVDDMLLVSEDEMKAAMANYHRSTGHLPEGAGAAALAAALRYRDRFAGKTICLLSTGANVDEGLRQEVIGDHG